MTTHNHSSSASHDDSKNSNIQIILSGSYSLFLFAFVLGLMLDAIIRLRINIPNIEIVGMILMILSVFVIYWAQTVNKKPKYLTNGERDFTCGPYAFSRHPTYVSLFILMIGAAFSMNSYSLILSAIISFIVAIYTFMNKEEKRHIKKYGEVYLKYMKKVRKII